MVALSWLIIMGWMLPCGMSLCFAKGCSGEEKGPEEQRLRWQASLPTGVFPLCVWREAEVEECTITSSCSRTCTLLPRVRWCSWHWSFPHRYDCLLLLGLRSGSFKSSHKSDINFASAFGWSRLHTLAIRCSTSTRETKHLPVKFSEWVPRDPYAGLWFPCRHSGPSPAEPSLTRHVNKCCCEPPCCLEDRRLPLHKAANLLRGECSSNSKTFSLQTSSSCFFPLVGEHLDPYEQDKINDLLWHGRYC